MQVCLSKCIIAAAIIVFISGGGSMLLMIATQTTWGALIATAENVSPPFVIDSQVQVVVLQDVCDLLL